MEMFMNETIDYYDKNAENFIETTQFVNLLNTQERFLRLLKNHAAILDFGCGSGRDIKYFLSKGYSVEAIDGSKEICARAAAYTGIQVKQMLFGELDDLEKYDGIWACSSILHLPKEELTDVLGRMKCALKQEGVIYTSFKYGDFEGRRRGRYFTDFTEAGFRDYMKQIPGLAIEEIWTTKDVRPERKEETWLNLILRKTNIR